VAKNYYDITLALAGICQSVRLIQQSAHEGLFNSDRYNHALHASLNSLLKIDSTSTLAVYGGNEIALQVGLETLHSILNANRETLAAERTRYTLSLMVLERKLNANQSALDTLSQRISQLDRQLTHFDIDSDTMLNALASIYIDVISPLGPRIQVTGSPEKLKNRLIQNKIRAILLAGIRSCVLWQQLGGGRLQLMFRRHQLLKQTQTILTRIQ